MKQCARCKQWKEDEEFNWRWKDRGIRQSVCRSCQVGDRKEWYYSHADAEKARTRALKKKAIEEAQYFIYDYLSNATCADCGEYDFTVLTFHHVRGKKKMDVSAMAAQGYAIEAIKEEIAKCEILCFSCHMRREFEGKSGGRFRKFWKWPWEK